MCVIMALLVTGILGGAGGMVALQVAPKRYARPLSHRVDVLQLER
jgi:hypothetical protein